MRQKSKTISKNLSQKLYDQRWQKDDRSPDFSIYERNRLLPEFFPDVQGLKLLDIGCGPGIIAGFFKARGYRIWGIDISPSAIQTAKQLHSGTFTCGDIEQKLPYRSSFFDTVFMGDVIEHLFSPRFVLKEAKRVLKHGGNIIISTPNYGFFLYRWHYFKTGALPNTEGHRGEIWDSGHIRQFNAGNMGELLQQAGFSVVKVSGVNKSRLFDRLATLYPQLFATIIIIEARRK